MTGVGESAGSTAKILEVLKDIPLWLLTGLALSASVLLLPAVSKMLPPVARPWLVLCGVVFGVLAVARAMSALLKAIPLWRASADARRKFHITGVPQHSFWTTAKQVDDSILTQISAHLLV